MIKLKDCKAIIDANKNFYQFHLFMIITMYAKNKQNKLIKYNKKESDWINEKVKIIKLI